MAFDSREHLPVEKRDIKPGEPEFIDRVSVLGGRSTRDNGKMPLRDQSITTFSDGSGILRVTRSPDDPVDESGNLAHTPIQHLSRTSLYW